jgi:tetratricopeptide (TPR) repeat protein
VQAALDQFPLDGVEPLDRPYGELAALYAFAERPDLARAALGDFDDALAPELRRAADPTRRTILGLIAVAEDRPREAISEFRRADDGACAICILPLLGVAYDHAGAPDSAIAVWERFLTTPWIGRLNLDGLWLGRIYDRLGELYAERGDPEIAIEYSARLMELWKDADPEFQSRVEAARVRVRALTADRPPR